MDTRRHVRVVPHQVFTVFVASLVASVTLVSCGGGGSTTTSPTTTPTPTAPATSAVQIEVWLENPPPNSPGAVTSVSIDGTNLALTSTLSDGVLITVGTAPLTLGTHTARFTVSQTNFPVVRFDAGDVSSVMQVQGPAVTLGGPGCACVWQAYVPSGLFTGTVGFTFTVF